VAVETKQPLDTMHARELSALADFKALLAALARLTPSGQPIASHRPIEAHDPLLSNCEAWRCRAQRVMCSACA
jgi:hypothetical protein